VIFPSPIFLFLFFPLLISLYFLLSARSRIPFLLLCSFFFYYWAEGRNVLLLLALILVTHGFVSLIRRSLQTWMRRLFLLMGIAVSLALLVYFKYLPFLTGAKGRHPPLPLGISFITFLAVSCLIDSYRSPREKSSFSRTALYISFFPAISSGPITPWRELQPQFTGIGPRAELLDTGVRRFIVGLAKKVLVADVLGKTVQAIFSIPGPRLDFFSAWVGIVFYTLQLYFDFSGYTDMAVGIGRILGVRLPENFRYPYAARSITDFWTRWHMSLTRWLRDYLFLPLSFKMLRMLPQEKYLGIRAESWAYGIGMSVTMVLCGFWHGAAWTFLIWGAIQALFILCERFWWGKILRRSNRLLQHGYALLAVMAGLVFFRSPTVAAAAGYLKALFGFSSAATRLANLVIDLDLETTLAVLAAILGSLPVVPRLISVLQKWKRQLPGKWGEWCARGWNLVQFFGFTALLVLGLLYMANSTFQPFIYFRF